MKKKLISFLFLILIVGCGIMSACTDKNLPSLGNTVIIGDSYSTFEGYIPEDYASWYTKNASYTDVNAVSQTWWHSVISKTKSNLILNSSYSGSTICNTGYDGEDYSDISFVSRVQKLTQSGYLVNNKVDTVIIYGGLNDYWAGVPAGQIDYEDNQEGDLYCLYPALIHIFELLTENAPNANIIFIVEETISNNIKDNFYTICSHYNVDAIEPRSISKRNSHPDIIGMSQISSQIVSHLQESDRYNKKF